MARNGRCPLGTGARGHVPTSSCDPVRRERTWPSGTTALPVEAWGPGAYSCSSYMLSTLAAFPKGSHPALVPWPRSCCCARSSGDGSADVSTDPAPALFPNEHAAKISIKLPETLRFPHRLPSRAGEGSQLTEVTMPFEGVLLGSQVVNHAL